MAKTHEEIEYYANLVIGAAIEVHREIGPGYLEAAYEGALAHEFDLRHIPYEQQAPIGVTYKQVLVGQSRLDFLVGECLVVELKAVEGLSPIHQAQVISYLKATGLNLGLLINFNVTMLKSGLRRVVYRY
jgi:GxxExxY protein